MTSQDEDEATWRGCSMDEVYRNLSPFELRHVKPVRPSDTHSVLYHCPIKDATSPPRPIRGHGKWDAYHVRLPSSLKSQYPVTQEDGSVTIESRWEMIEKALLKPIRNSRELEAAILSYNSKYQKDWNFRSLHELLEYELDGSESEAFFEDLLPKIIALALRLPELIPNAIPLLRQGQNRSISLSQQQISCLLANAFLCTFPRRNTMKKKSEYSNFPDINFNRLFQSSGASVREKIKCISHYFRRVCNSVPLGAVTFTRRSIALADLPNWSECEAPLGVTPLHVTSTGTIEDQGQGLLQVDFANKYLGGGVLGSGCVQEEIRFVICPELIVSKLFTEALKPAEALIMVGSEQYSLYSGYAGSFQWGGNYEDDTPFDDSRRRQCHIVAIDALYFLQSSHQYREELMLRELNKAYVGFFHPLDTPAPGVASGNWGCGAFGGEATLKALLQLMVCTVTQRPLVYFTFGNSELRDAIHKMHTFFIENDVRVKHLWAYMRKFREQKLTPSELYSYICKAHNRKSAADDAGWFTSLLTGRKANPDSSPPPATTSSEPTPQPSTSANDVSDESNEPQASTNKTDSPDLFVSDSPETEPDSPIVPVTPAENAEPKPTPTSGKKPEARQRSLLEMLDQCYTITASPAKRHCPTPTQFKKN